MAGPQGSPVAEEEVKEIPAPPVTPKSPGVLGSLKKALGKCKTADILPEALIPSSSVAPTRLNLATITLPSRKKASLKSLSGRSIDDNSPVSSIDNRSTFSFREDSSFGGVLGRQGPYSSMGPPSSVAPSVASFSSVSSTSASSYPDPHAEIRRLQTLLRSSQEDLRMANNLVRFHEDQIRDLRARQDAELQEANARISALERNQKSPARRDER